MSEKNKNTSLTRAVVALALSLCLAFFSASAVIAADEPYRTWDDYKASGAPTETWNDVVDAMDDLLDYGVELYEAGDYDGAYTTVSNAYYGFYETTGFERIAMGYISGARKSEMELQFSAAKAVAKSQGSLDEFKTEVETLESMLRSDANQLDGVEDDSSDGSGSTSGTSAAAATFIACFGIMLREGFEAILIVGAIIAYQRKSAGEDKSLQKKKTYPIYLGSVLGIVMSFVLAWLLNLLKLANSASQEVIEGVTCLIAVCVLYYVSNWMLSKSETEAWNKYIKSKAEAASGEKGSNFALASTAFLAVFREGAEVVLFFQPLMKDENIGSVWAGFGVGCFALVFVFIAIHVLSIKLPLRPLFTFTSILMFVMSISFLGGGIKELIEGDVITMHSPTWLQWIPSNSVMEVLGIYTCLDTLIPQLILLVITIIVFMVQTKKNQQIRAEAEAAKAEQEAAAAAEEKVARDAELRKMIREVVAEMLAEGNANQ